MRRRKDGVPFPVACGIAAQHNAPAMNDAPAPTVAPAIPAAYFGERVTWVHHWTDRLFSFTARGMRISASAPGNSP